MYPKQKTIKHHITELSALLKRDTIKYPFIVTFRRIHPQNSKKTMSTKKKISLSKKKTLKNTGRTVINSVKI